MALDSAPPLGTDAPSREVEFALDRFDFDDDRLVVEGRWYGIAGRRFMRPVLQIEGYRRLMALLDHKPWRADDGAKWTAAFAHPDEGGPSRLQVAPDIAVEIPAPGPDAGDGARRPARIARPPIIREGSRFRRDEDEARADGASAAPAAPAPAAPAAAPTSAPRAPDPEPAARVSEHELERLRVERDEAIAEADRVRADLNHLHAELGILRRTLEDTHTTSTRLETDLVRAREEAARALADRNLTRNELERLRKTARQPYVAPRPMPFGEATRGGSDWRIRMLAAGVIAGAGFLLVSLLAALF